MAKGVKIEVDLEVDGMENALTALNKLRSGLLSFKKPFDRTIIWMHKSWADSFRSGRRGNRRWKANKNWTRKIKSGGMVLQDKGFLRNSLAGVAKGSFKKRTPWSLELGTTVKYAEIQDKGKKITITDKMRTYFAGSHGLFLKKKTTKIVIPARPFMFFQKKDIIAITKIFNMWIKEEAKKGGW